MQWVISIYIITLYALHLDADTLALAMKDAMALTLYYLSFKKD